MIAPSSAISPPSVKKLHVRRNMPNDIVYGEPMPERSTNPTRLAGPAPKDVRAAQIDDVDRRILQALHDDARLSNSALAELVGIAPSTCHGRLRRLQDIGVIRG